jgi:hypothetical protein
MSWGIKDMNPSLDPDDLLKAHPQSMERILTDWVMPAFLKVGTMYSPIPNTDRLKAYGLRAITQGTSVKALIRSIERLPDVFERFPSFSEFQSFVRGQSRSTDTKDPERNPWPEQISRVCDELIKTHGHKAMGDMAKIWFKGVFGSEPGTLGLLAPAEVSRYVMWMFVHDRLQAPKGCGMPELIEWSKRDCERAQREARNKLESEINKTRALIKR